MLRQGKLPFSNPEVEKAIESREDSLDALDQTFEKVQTEARDIKQVLSRDSTGDYPDHDDKDPLVSAAHKRSLDLVNEYKRLAHSVPTKSTELDAWQEAADRKKHRMDKILSRQGGPGIDTAEVMKMQIPHDKMLVLVQAVATRHGSLDFLRKLSAEHRQLLLSKEHEIAELKRAEQGVEVSVSSGIVEDDEVIPSTNPDVDYRTTSASQEIPTQVDLAQRDLAARAASLDAENKIKDLERQLKEATQKFEDEYNAHVETWDSLRKQLSEEVKSRKDSESAFEHQKDQLAISKDEVVKLTTKVHEMVVDAEKLKEGMDDHDDLLNQLDDSRLEVAALNERIDWADEDAASRRQLDDDTAELQIHMKLVEQQVQDLENQLQGKTVLLNACRSARDTAQDLADRNRSERDSMKTDLDKAEALKNVTMEEYYKTERQREKLQRDFSFEVEFHQTTRDVLTKEHQESIEAKDAEIIHLKGLNKSFEESIAVKNAEIIRLQGLNKSFEESATVKDTEIVGLQGLNQSCQESIMTKDAEIIRLQASGKSLDELLKAQAEENAQLTSQLKEKEEEVQSQARRIKDLSRECGDLELLGPELSKVKGEKADTQDDLSLIISTLSLGNAAVGLADWTPLLRSLRDADPLESVSPDENLSREVWAILPSWQSSPSQLDNDADIASEPVGLRSSTAGLLLHLYGCGMAEDAFPCNNYLQIIAALSSMVASQGPFKVSSLVLVLEKLMARLRRLVTVSASEAMVILSLRYLVALVKARMPGDDGPHVPGLPVIEAGLDDIMQQMDMSLNIIRQVSDDLCSYGNIERVVVSRGIQLSSKDGRSLVFLPDPAPSSELFLIAEPEKKTVRAVSSSRLDYKFTYTDVGEFEESTAIIKAPAGQSDINLELTREEYSWISEYL